MAQQIPAPQYKKKPDLAADWVTFRKGLNLLLRPTELGRDELSQADNILLTGSGVPTGRWGSAKYFAVNATGSIRGFATYNNFASLTNEILALSDQGYIAKKVGTVSQVITGQSYPSGTSIASDQLGGFTYIVSKDVPMTIYNGTSLAAFATISAPTGLVATNFSGATGVYQWSWKVTTLAPNGGETIPSNNYVLNNLPQDLTETQINIQWSAPSAASLAGYSIYRGLPGDETYVASVGASTTLYQDMGLPASDTIFPPLSNTTGGVKSRFITRFNDRLLFVDAGDPSKLLISARYPDQTKINWADGGGYVYVDPDSGRPITGIQVQPGSDKIVIFKDYSSYAVSLDIVQLGNFNILDPSYQPISTALGCSNPDTIQTVENDIFYFGKNGLYVVGYEPNFLSVIRTNEISARIRPYIQLLGSSDFTNCCSLYVNNKYLLSFPDRQEIVVYDRERGCFAGIWKLPFGITKMVKYVDGTNTERWVFGTTTNQVYTFEQSINSDDGTTINKTLRTNKEAFNLWYVLKIVKLFYILMRNITGTVTVNILLEDRTGATSVIKTFDITGAAIAGNSGWGANMWGNSLWGDTIGDPVVGSDEFDKWSQLFKSGRLLQIEVTTNVPNSNFELLQIHQTAASQGEGSLASSSRV